MSSLLLKEGLPKIHMHAISSWLRYYALYLDSGTWQKLVVVVRLKRAFCRRFPGSSATGHGTWDKSNVACQQVPESGQLSLAGALRRNLFEKALIFCFNGHPRNMSHRPARGLPGKNHAVSGTSEEALPDAVSDCTLTFSHSRGSNWSGDQATSRIQACSLSPKQAPFCFCNFKAPRVP